MVVDEVAKIYKEKHEFIFQTKLFIIFIPCPYFRPLIFKTE